jgi:hypothetical protein
MPNRNPTRPMPLKVAQTFQHYDAASVQFCFVVCILLGTTSAGNYSVGGGVGPKVDVSYSRTGGMSSGNGLSVGGTCSVETPVGGSTIEAGIISQSNNVTGGYLGSGRTYGLGLGCSANALFSW